MKSLTILIFIIFSFEAYSKEELIFGVTKQTLNSSQGQFSVKLYTQILKDLGHDMKIVVLPPLRLAKQTQKGSTDGELIRKSNYAKKNPHLIRVEEPTFKFSIAAYSSVKSIIVKNWADLKEFKLGHRRGMKVIEVELSKRFPNKKIIIHADPKKLLTLTSKDRIDIYIGVEYLTDEVLKKLPQANEKVKKLSILKRDSAHLFLSKKYQHLAKQISKKLVLYKTNGKYQEIRKNIK